MLSIRIDFEKSTTFYLKRWKNLITYVRLIMYKFSFGVSFMVGRKLLFDPPSNKLHNPTFSTYADAVLKRITYYGSTDYEVSSPWIQN